MPCQHVKLPDGSAAIVCGPRSRRRCCVEGCKAEVTRECDWKVPTRKSGTCDKPMCAFHSYTPKGYDDKDLCPDHRLEWKRRLAAKEDAVQHHCHWPTCKRAVPPKMWGCKEHWFRLPKPLRDRIWRTYVPGQEITKTPSPEYLEAAQAVQDWIANEIREGRAT